MKQLSFYFLLVLLFVFEDMIITSYFIPVRVVSCRRQGLTYKASSNSAETESAAATTVTEKKKKNLLSKEILRGSTIVISSDDKDVSNPEKERMRRRPNVNYSLIRRTLLHYKMRNGDMLVPTKFTVPGKSNDWPKEMWGMRLGKIVQSIRGGRRSDKREDLTSIGFCFNVASLNFEVVKNALLAYKKQHKNLLIPRHFVVPNTSNYEEHSWGMKLGNIVSNIRTGKSCYVDKKAELIQMGFAFDAIEARFELLKLALISYKNKPEFGNLPVNPKFVIPRTNDWPEETWGVKLGNAISDIKRGRFREKEEELKEIGFTFKKSKKIDYDTVVDAIRVFRELNHENTKIPSGWKIPENSDFYPEKSWGVCLGSIVGRIRRGEKWPEKREHFLSFFEFEWDH